MAVPYGAGSGVFDAKRSRYSPGTSPPPPRPKFDEPPDLAGGPSAPGGGSRYRVARGDTLGEIARAAGMTLADLTDYQTPDLRARLSANPDLIHEGESLRLPDELDDDAVRAVRALRPAQRGADGGGGGADASLGVPSPGGPSRAVLSGVPMTGDPRTMLESGTFSSINKPPVGTDPSLGRRASVESSLDMDQVARDVDARFGPTMRGALGAGITGGVALGTGGLGLGAQSLLGAAGGALGEGVAGSSPAGVAMGALGGALGPPVGRAVGAGLGAAGRWLGLLPDPSLPAPTPMTPRPGFGPGGLPPPSRGPSMTVDAPGAPGTPQSPVPLPGSAARGAPSIGGGSPAAALGGGPTPGGLPAGPVAGALPPGPTRGLLPAQTPLGEAIDAWELGPDQATTGMRSLLGRAAGAPPPPDVTSVHRGLRLPESTAGRLAPGQTVDLGRPSAGGLASFSTSPDEARMFAVRGGSGVPAMMHMRPKQGLELGNMMDEVLVGGQGAVRGVRPPTSTGGPMHIDVSQVAGGGLDTGGAAAPGSFGVSPPPKGPLSRIGTDPRLPPVRPVTLGGGETLSPSVVQNAVTNPARPGLMPPPPQPGAGGGVTFGPSVDDLAFASEPTMVRGAGLGGGVGSDATAILGDVDTLVRGGVSAPPRLPPPGGAVPLSAGGAGISPLTALAGGLAPIAGLTAAFPIGNAINEARAAQALRAKALPPPLPAPYAVPMQQPFATSTTAQGLLPYAVER